MSTASSSGTALPSLQQPVSSQQPTRSQDLQQHQQQAVPHASSGASQPGDQHDSDQEGEHESEEPIETYGGRYSRFDQVLGRGAFKTVGLWSSSGCGSTLPLCCWACAADCAHPLRRSVLRRGHCGAPAASSSRIRADVCLLQAAHTARTYAHAAATAFRAH